MAFSAIDICSQAMMKLGANQISSFEESTAESRIAHAFYETVKKNLLSSFPWTFAVKVERLAQLSGVPETDFSYAFSLPHRFLKIISAGSSQRSSGLKYEIRENILYANSDVVHLTYIADIEETEFPAFFTQALVSRLAYEFCLPLTENTTLANFLQKKSKDEEKQTRLIDSQQETPRAILKFPFIQARS